MVFHRKHFFNPKHLNDTENEFVKFILNFQVTLIHLEQFLVETRSWDTEREKIEPGFHFP